MIGIIKGDIRYTYLNMLLKDSICSYELCDYVNIDTLVLPFKGIDNEYNIYDSMFNLNDFVKNNNITKIFVGKANNTLKKYCINNKIKLYEILKDREFVKENALLTSRGLLFYLEDLICKYNGNITILGYGNISFYLAKLLTDYGVKFKIYTENKLEEKFADLDGYIITDNPINKLIINTIPKNLEYDYSKMKNSKIIDVASKPYGFDIEKIDSEKIDYRIYSLIPSKYNPYLAAILIKNYIESVKL